MPNEPTEGLGRFRQWHRRRAVGRQSRVYLAAVAGGRPTRLVMTGRCANETRADATQGTNGLLASLVLSPENGGDGFDEVALFRLVDGPVGPPSLCSAAATATVVASSGPPPIAATTREKGKA